MPKGTDDELEKVIIEKISVLGKDGGYMIAPTHILQNDVSPERVLKLIELHKKMELINDLLKVKNKSDNADYKYFEMTWLLLRYCTIYTSSPLTE